jgi:hypothetical protein
MAEARSGQPQENRFRVRGKPGSVERRQQARELLGNDALFYSAQMEELGHRLARVVQLHAEGRNGDDRTVAELVRLTEGLDPSIVREVAGMVEQTLTDAGAYDVSLRYDDAISEAWNNRVEREQADYADAEAKRMKARYEMMRAEVQRAGRDGSREDMRAAQEVAHMVDPETLYDADALSNDEIRAAMRAAAAASERERKAASTLNFLEKMHAEIERGIGAPGSSWNDDQRERWQRDLFEARAATVLQHVPQADVIEAEAWKSVEDDKRGPRSFIAQVEAEAARMTGQTEHREALADQAVENAKKHQEQLRQWGLR